MSQRIGATAAFGVAVTILLLLVAWNSAAGTGEVRFTQPYQPSGWRFWEGRKSARHPSEIFWASAGQVLRVRHEDQVERGAAELTVRGLLTSSPRQLIGRSSAGAAQRISRSQFPPRDSTRFG